MTKISTVILSATLLVPAVNGNVERFLADKLANDHHLQIRHKSGRARSRQIRFSSIGGNHPLLFQDRFVGSLTATTRKFESNETANYLGEILTTQPEFDVMILFCSSRKYSKMRANRTAIQLRKWIAKRYKIEANRLVIMFAGQTHTADINLWLISKRPK